MSQHPSLRIDPTGTRHRNVLKRHERVQRLQELEKWNNRPSALGLPKVKSLKIKIKKIKSEKAETAAPAAGAAATAEAAATAQASAEKKKAAPPEKKAGEKK